tara:strand:+ start:44 stop:679 length:636 start_codon:yes stop_codon:yes gene_type:complete
MARFDNSNLYTGTGTGQLEQDSMTCFHLVEVYLDTPINLTDRFYDTTITTPTKGTSTTYSAVGGLLGFSSVLETTQIKVNTISIQLSAGDNSSSGLIAEIMTTPLVNKRVVIYRSFDTDTSIGNMNKTFLMFDGNIKNFNVTEGGKDASININVATHWANFQQKNGRITNSTTQANTTRYGTGTQPKFSSDRGFEYSSAMIADITWGPKSN